MLLKALKRKRFLFVLLGVALFVVVGGSLAWLLPLTSPAPNLAHASDASLPNNITANGPYSVSGNRIKDASGNEYIFHGIGRDGLEFNCSGDNALDRQHLAFMGSAINTASPAAGTYWGANTVRLPLSEGFWLNGAPGYPCSAGQYQALVKKIVDDVTALKLNVILDLQWVDAGGHAGQGGSPAAMPDNDSVTFWQQVAGRYKGYNNVLFELFNEPHQPQTYSSSPNMWQCWLSGCDISKDNSYADDCRCTKSLSYHAVGMQTLVDTVRNAGASNLAIVGGLSWGYELSKLPNYQITGSNVVYDTHPYPYAGKQPTDWDSSFGTLTNTYPIISAESGQYDCKSNYVSQLLDYFDNHRMSWMVWAWIVPQGNSPPCGYPQLITDNNGTPTNWSGQYIYQRMRSYAPYNGPLSNTWYFAEGRVASNFTEVLSFTNPDPVNDCAVTIKYLLESGGTISKNVVVPHNSRITEGVNADLGTQNVQQGVSLSALVSVDTTTCSGIVAERPMYYSFQGVNSNSDIMGATRLNNSFYFADVPTGAGYTSFLSILNPPGNQAADVTATYYLGGNVVSSQSVTVQAGQRGTISPNDKSLPTHVSAVVTSSQPIMVERPLYLKDIAAGNAQNVTGGSSMMGAQALSNDWLFAEGYTGNGFQEYLAIANLDSNANAAANVTIKLQFSDGSTHSYNATVNAKDQLLWDVNQVAPNQSVSAEVTSQGANIVVQRQLYFHYKGTTQGGNDVVGLPGPATSSNASYYVFAEGFTPNGYDEWLTLQNPTGSAEAVILYLVNGRGKGYTPGGIALPAHSRQTVDISSLVRQNMYQSGESTAGYAVSMLVQGTPGSVFVAERPFYVNLNNGATQGGSDVIGYSGG